MGVSDLESNGRIRYTRGPYHGKCDSPGDPDAESCRGFQRTWLPTGRCPVCNRHWTDIYNTRDHKRSPFNPRGGFADGRMLIPSHKVKALRQNVTE